MQKQETCTWCRFDSARWTRNDLAQTLDCLGAWWRELVVGVEPALLVQRPAPTTWSAVEYAVHSGDILRRLDGFVEAILTIDDLDVGAPPPADARADDPAPTVAFPPAVDELECAARRLARRQAEGAAGGWHRTARFNGDLIDAGDVFAHAVHDATHHLMDAGRGLHALGAPPGGGGGVRGSVAQLNVSDGGVPKRAVPVARIGVDGMEGDRQATRRHHGRPWQALCLWSLEVIEGLRREGHPVGPGLAGENVTVAGVDWAALRPGVRLRLGEALVETSLWALPCWKNRRWFLGGDYHRMSHTRERGDSRIYAWVLEGGEVRTGDPVVVEP